MSQSKQTVVDVRDLAFGAPKHAAATTPDGRVISHYTVEAFIAHLRVKGVQFQFVNAKGETPAHMKGFVNGVNIIVWDEADLSRVTDGSTPVRIEVCATIARKGPDGPMVDGNVYLTVRPVGAGEMSDRLVTVHQPTEVPKAASAVYGGRCGVVAIRPLEAAAPARP